VFPVTDGHHASVDVKGTKARKGSVGTYLTYLSVEAEVCQAKTPGQSGQEPKLVSLSKLTNLGLVQVPASLPSLPYPRLR
jgi:hypothetical protein